MKSIHKTFFSFLIVISLAIHFLCIIVYASPVKQIGILNSASNMYCYPYFHQQWTVFVPAPSKKFDLYIRNGKDNRWQNWINITNRLIEKSRSNHFSGGETEVLLLSNSINYLIADLGEQNLIFNNPPNLASFKILERAAKYYFRNYRCWRDGKDYELLIIARSGKTQTLYYFKNLSLV